MELWQLVLFLHIMVALVAFGPTFAFPFIGKAMGEQPRHSKFALGLIETIEKKLIIPLAVAMPFLGLWLIYLRDWDLWQSEWLVVSIVLYTISFFYSLFVMNPTLHKLLEFANKMEQAGPPPGAPGAAGHPAPVQGAQAAGPPPEIAGLVKRQKLGGMFLSILTLTILLLMVWKPGGEFIG